VPARGHIAAYSDRWSLDAQDGETRDAFARRTLANHIRDHLVTYEADQAALTSITDSDLAVIPITITDPDDPDPPDPAATLADALTDPPPTPNLTPPNP